MVATALLELTGGDIGVVTGYEATLVVVSFFAVRARPAHPKPATDADPT